MLPKVPEVFPLLISVEPGDWSCVVTSVLVGDASMVIPPGTTVTRATPSITASIAYMLVFIVLNYSFTSESINARV